MTEQPYADPSDLQFGKAAAEKEETLDELIDQGESLESVEAEERERRQKGLETTPRAGNKAPVGGDS
jgi:hypothetical protein